jgi:YbbR domain-containing protein
MDFKRFTEGLRRNSGSKLFSLVAAAILWGYVILGQPMVEVSRKVPLHLVTPNSLVRVSDFVGQLDVMISGPRNIIRNIRSEDLSYEIDATNYGAGEIPIKFNEYLIDGIPSGVTITSISPTQIRIVLEDRANRKVPVSIVTQGKVEQSYRVVEMVADPAIVEITGGIKQIGRLKSVPTNQVVLDGKNESFSVDVGVDLAGRHIDLVEQTSVMVKIEIAENFITRHFDAIPIQVIETSLKAMVKPGAQGVDLQGPEKMMKNLKAEDIQLVIDASGLEPGTYQLKPKIRLTNLDVAFRYDLPAVTVTLKQGKKVTISGKKVKIK